MVGASGQRIAQTARQARYFIYGCQPGYYGLLLLSRVYLICTMLCDLLQRGFRSMPQDKYVLVVDDEESIQDFIKHSLEARSFKVKIASNGLEALALFEQTNCILVILDIMMPKMDGLEVCRRIRQSSTVPIIVLTALGEEADKIAALDQGADDYLTKPFGVGELLARVKAVIRRSHWTETPISVATQ